MEIKKLKFFKIQTSLTVIELLKIINSNQYNSKNLLGFETYESNNDMIYCKFIEEIELKEIIVNPFGYEKEIITTRYTYFDFKIIYNNNDKFLKIITPPKALNSFFKLLSKVTNRNFFKESIYLNLDSLYQKIIKNKDIHRCLVPRINISSLLISEFSNAKIEVSSMNNAYMDFLKFYDNKNYKIDKIKLNFRLYENFETIEINSTGLIHVSSSLESFFESLIY